jgi:hypothetical protein
MQHTGELPIVTVDHCAVCLDFRHLCRETRQSIFGLTVSGRSILQYPENSVIEAGLRPKHMQRLPREARL